ncbi:MAG: glycosyltransferase [Actinobacteria bacterium]|nr:glycosyltransferase [Actinomycetota bacterium]
MNFSVVIPVYNGERYLAEVLEAIAAQRVDGDVEVLVIDSGSTDRSVEIARQAGVRLIEIANSEFQHGRTRNMAMAQTSGDLVAFLTQDATPAGDGWLQAYANAFTLEPGIGAAYGPHLPRPGASPMMARMLTEFFGAFSPDGETVIHRPGDTTYLSNSNSCVARAAWNEIPFREIPYAEDQALGADLLAAGWKKAYVPAAGALHSHDYGTVEQFKRHFDEYRGLRDSIGHKTKASPTNAFKTVAGAVRDDVRWMRETERRGGASLAAWSARSSVHHAGRVLFGGLGARADRIPPLLRRAMSLEQRSDGVSRRIPPSSAPGEFDYVGRFHAQGPAPLREPRPGDAETESLHVAWVVPPFNVGGGGHMVIFRMVQALERRGHSCSIWVHDPEGIEHSGEAGLHRRVNEFYAEVEAPVHLGFSNWSGADVVMATGWQTVYPAMLMPHCGGRAYLVLDHEPEFYATSSQSVFAGQTYRVGLKCIAGSPWLAELLRERYGADATAFEFGIEPGEYHEDAVARRGDTVVYYARNFTERRAVELGLLALDQVVRRRPNTNVVLFGTHHALQTPFPHEHLGVVSPERLRRLYSEATVGLSTSLTNYSLIPSEMMACGLPVVELAGRACESVFGHDGETIALAQDDPVSIADAIVALLDDEQRRARQSAAGLQYVGSHPWSDAFDVLEDSLYELLRERVAEAAARS